MEKKYTYFISYQYQGNPPHSNTSGFGSITITVDTLVPMQEWSEYFEPLLTEKCTQECRKTAPTIQSVQLVILNVQYEECKNGY